MVLILYNMQTFLGECEERNTNVNHARLAYLVTVKAK